jgi:hypothetical protein
MSAARHLRVVDTETGEVHHEGDCAHCADARSEAETWEQEVLKLKRQVKRLMEDKDAKDRNDKLYPAAADLFDEWARECNHPKARFDPARVRLALSAIKAYGKEDREKLSWVIQCGKHLAYVDPCTGERHDSFGLLFRDSEHIEKYANKYARWQKRNA